MDERPDLRVTRGESNRRSPGPLDSSVDLLGRAKGGDRRALDQLLERYIPPFRSWASGRLPQWARGAMDTEDLVHETVIRLIEHQDEFQFRGDGAFLAYLREALRNRIRDELRRVARWGPSDSVGDSQVDGGPSPLDQTIEHEMLDRYECALERLPDHERNAIVARVELGLSWKNVAEATGKRSADAARMAVTRAVRKLAEEMSRGCD